MIEWEQDVTGRAIETIAGDRRRDRRYFIQLDVRWKLIRRKRVLDTGTGRTIDMSSGGILFESEKPLHPGLNVELSISWPVLLHNVAPLQLVVSGRIMRVNGNRNAIRMTQHEFRTAPASSTGRPPAHNPGALRNALQLPFATARP